MSRGIGRRRKGGGGGGAFEQVEQGVVRPPDGIESTTGRRRNFFNPKASTSCKKFINHKSQTNEIRRKTRFIILAIENSRIETDKLK